MCPRKKISRLAFYLYGFLFIALILGCASTPRAGRDSRKNSGTGAIKPIKFNKVKYTNAYAKGDYKTCVGMEIARDKNGSDVLASIDEGMLLHMTGGYSQSKSALNKTSDLIESFRKSGGEAFSKALFNTRGSYCANVYEIFLVNAINALNYYDEGDIEGALVEIRKIDVNQKDILDVYNTEFSKDDAGPQLTDEELEKARTADEIKKKEDEKREKTQEALNALGLGMADIMKNDAAPRPPKDEDKYNDSSFVRYVSAKLYAVAGDPNAAVDARKLAMLNSNFSDAVDSEITIPEGFGRLDILALAGKVADRAKGVIRVPPTILLAILPVTSQFFLDSGLLNIPITFPKFDKRNQSTLTVKSTVWTGVDGVPHALELKQLEDFDDSVQKDIKTKAYKAYVASVFRSLPKKFATMVAAEATALAGVATQDELMASLALLGAKKTLEAADASENPDLRHCYYIPRRAYAGGVNLSPGDYSVVITYSNGFIDVRDVKIESGKWTIVESTRIR